MNFTWKEVFFFSNIEFPKNQKIARDIWQGVGQAFKYRSTFRLINKKFQQKGGMIGSVEVTFCPKKI